MTMEATVGGREEAVTTKIHPARRGARIEGQGGVQGRETCKGTGWGLLRGNARIKRVCSSHLCARLHVYVYVVLGGLLCPRALGSHAVWLENKRFGVGSLMQLRVRVRSGLDLGISCY